MLVDPSTDADIDAITTTYGHWVRHGLASFELEPPDRSEMANRRAAILAGGHPYLVARGESGRILGFAYAGPYRTRPAYRFTIEDSVYVAPDALGMGVGAALLSRLIPLCADTGRRLMVAVIGDSGNTASIRLHARFGFTRAGLLPAAGWKHGRWVDSVLMTLPLGDGSASPPD